MPTYTENGVPRFLDNLRLRLAAEFSTWSEILGGPFHSAYYEDRLDSEHRRRVAARREQLKLSTLLLALLLSTLPALGADKAPKKPRPRPSAQISIKVHPEKFNAGTPLAGKRLHLSTVTKTSCTAWIQADEDPLWTAGLSACRAALRANKE